MKRFVLLFLLLPALVFAGSSNHVNIAFVETVSTASCTDISNSYDASNDDYWSNSSDNISQGVKYEDTCTIDSVTLNLEYSSASTGHVELWTSEDMSEGTQIGGDSAEVTTIETRGNYEFSWSSNKPAPSADYFIHFVGDAGAKWFSTTDGAYEGSDYKAWRGSDGSVTGLGDSQDFIFAVDYE